MAILIDRQMRVIIQGITGREGSARARLMKGYGTNVVAGVSPGRGGAIVEETIPVYATVADAVARVGAVDASVLFIPPLLVKDAALEAIAVGVKFLVIVPDRVPIHDVMELSRAAKDAGASFLGPNTLGCLAPGIGVLGMIGGSAENARKLFKRGRVGVASRSGGITSSIAYYLGRADIGASSIVHVGGDSIIGLPLPDVMLKFQDDADTDAVVMFGEIGTSQEERVADLIEGGRFTKPLIAYIGGKGARKGTRFSHAGAIIEGNVGTWEGKVERLRAVGATVVDAFYDLPAATIEVLKKRNMPIVCEEVTQVTEIQWKTAITRIKPNEIRVRGYRIDELMGKVTFADAIWLALTGDLPDAALSRLINAILVSSVDHGATPPSTLAARTVASTGAPQNAAVAAGVLAINKLHGGAIEECMRTLIEAVKRAKSDGASFGAAAAEILGEYKQQGKRVSGFGHRIHTDDPRTKRLFDLAETAGKSGDHIRMVKAVEDTFTSQGKSLPINVDGAIAAVLCDLGIDPKLANGFFIMARVPGLVAHVAEEQTRERPMRSIHPTDHGYDGPDPREMA